MPCRGQETGSANLVASSRPCISLGYVGEAGGRASTKEVVEVILDNTLLYNNITEIITREYAIMNEIQSY